MIISNFLITVMAALAVFSTFAVYQESPIQFLRRNEKGGVTGSITWGLLFGLPFAYLQWKRDVTSAMIAHGVVDFIRF
ncbi:hypothetical protein QW71_02105 [Paenibacillus sp. IHB B 3415]|uniref:hypothetical protein n=1 Tax=Paenibacillus sp. IHB B 3415 TaxID=867080 RepID=UPI000574CC91|nr:hypothetical protein [Paenibacillus sp. IHB B 3415]KHL97347.1 hypothetical protein QW71_02105 [Paenibacillus sp. IHB B 3415]